MEAVQSDLASLKKAFDKAHTPAEKDTNQEYGRVNQSQFRRRCCDACHSAGVERCDHCFKCGSADHFARGCSKGYGSGNEEATATGQGVAGEVNMFHACKFCGKKEGNIHFEQCGVWQSCEILLERMSAETLETG